MYTLTLLCSKSRRHRISELCYYYQSNKNSVFSTIIQKDYICEKADDTGLRNYAIITGAITGSDSQQFYKKTTFFLKCHCHSDIVGGFFPQLLIFQNVLLLLFSDSALLPLLLFPEKFISKMFLKIYFTYILLMLSVF